MALTVQILPMWKSILFPFFSPFSLQDNITILKVPLLAVHWFGLDSRRVATSGCAIMLFLLLCYYCELLQHYTFSMSEKKNFIGISEISSLNLDSRV